MCKHLVLFYCSIHFKGEKILSFWEDVTPVMENDEFRRFFRMNKETLQSLTNYLRPIRRSYQGGHEQISPAKMVAVTVAFLGSQSPCKQLSNMFSMTESCFVKVSEYIMELVTDKSQHIIKWPSKDQYAAVAQEFNKRRIRLVFLVNILYMNIKREHETVNSKL